MSSSSSDGDSGSEIEYGPRDRRIPLRRGIVAWRRRHVQRRVDNLGLPTLRIFATNNNQENREPRFFRNRRCTRAGIDRSYLFPYMDVDLVNKDPGTLDYLFHRYVSRNLVELHLEGFASLRPQLSTGRGRLYLPSLRVLSMNALHPKFSTDLQLDAPSLQVLKIHNPKRSYNGRIAPEITNQIEELHVTFGEFHNTIVADQSVPFRNLRRLSLDGDDAFFLEEHFTRFAKQLIYAEVSTENPSLVICLAMQATNLQVFFVYAEAFVNVINFRKLLNLQTLVFTGYYSPKLLQGFYVVLPRLHSLSVEIEMAPHFITPMLRELEVVIREEEFGTANVMDHFNRIDHHVLDATFRVQDPNVYAVPMDLICSLTQLRSLRLIRVKLQQSDVRDLLNTIRYMQRLRFTLCNIVASFGEPENDAFFAHLRSVFYALEIIVD